MAVTITIATMVVSFTSISLDAWNRSRSEIRAARQAKSMTDSMARDLDALVLRKGNPFQWLSAEVTTPDSNRDGIHRSPNGARLVFFSAATDRYNGQAGSPETDNGGNVSTIAYELQYKDPIGDTRNEDRCTFVLYRKIVNPDNTFNDLLCKTDLSRDFDAYSPSVGDLENFICENVYQFTVTFHVEVDLPGGSGIRHIPVQIGQNHPATTFEIFGDRITTSSTGNSGVTANQLSEGKLHAVEISLTILTDFGIRQMRGRTFSSPGDKSDFIGKNSYQYSRLIPVSCL